MSLRDHPRPDAEGADQPGRWRRIYLAVIGFNILVLLSLWILSQAF